MEFEPYIFQCEADFCLRTSRDLDSDDMPWVHPECAKYANRGIMDFDDEFLDMIELGGEG